LADEREQKVKPVFSILIPTWNNLSHLKLLIRSLKENSAFQHQILIHVNEGNDGTIDWLKDQEIRFNQSDENIGICKAMNGLFEMSEWQYIVYFNDDMYACPGWDTAMQKAIDQAKDDKFYFSASMIEPRDSGNKCVFVFDAGSCVEHFIEQDLIAQLSNLKRTDWNGASWPPSLMHRDLWKEIGGFSEEFTPGLYSDPDISMKLWKAGVREFRGVGDSLVYHFMQKSTGRVKLNDGKKQFLQKWGVSASNFNQNVLKLGTSYTGPLPESKIKPSIKDLLKRLI
jgi:GT2 family glycosyltransferase